MSKLHKKTGSVCIICDEPTEKTILFHKTRRQTHSLCIDCSVGYLRPLIVNATNNIRKNIRVDVDKIKCPGAFHGEARNQCKKTVTFSSLQLPECEISLDLFRLTYVLSTYNAYICPEMKCGQVVEVDTEYNGSNLLCHGGCQTTWCRNCLISPFHDGKSCLEVEAENNKTENGKCIWKMKQEGKLKFCPRCKAPCIKYNGCNKMVCGSCHVKWCWLCTEPDIDYDHFKSGRVGKCTGKLWEGLDENGNDLPEPLPEPHVNNMIVRQNNPYLPNDLANMNALVNPIPPPEPPAMPPIHFRRNAADHLFR